MNKSNTSGSSPITHHSLLNGGLFTDERGSLMHFNDFNMEGEGVRRFYITENADTTVIRAWQGHKVETKWFCPVSGAFLVGLVEIDDWDKPSAELIAKRLILSDRDPSVLKIPPGYANGFRALEPGSRMLIFSDKPFEEAEKVVFDQSLWMNWNLGDE